MSSQERQEFEDEDDWTGKFIQVVQSKPPLYNTSLPEHCDRNLNSRLWNEVVETMVPTWQKMTSKEKSLKARDLQNKWRNLRTCFRRELNKQKNGTGQAASKRRKYMYFQQLLFLLPNMKDLPTLSECSPSNTQGDSSEGEGASRTTQSGKQSQDNTLNNLSGASTSTQQLENTPENNSSRTIQLAKQLQDNNLNNTSRAGTSTQQLANRLAKSQNTPRCEESLLTILKEKRDEEIDEDKSFLLSLVPTFRKLSESQKIDAKIEFLSTLKRLVTQHRQDPSYPAFQEDAAHSTYSSQGFEENHLSQQNCYYNQRIKTCVSRSSTPNPVVSDGVSRSSSVAPNNPNQDFAEYS